VTLTQAAAGGPFSGTFTLNAVGGTVAFGITVPPGLIVSPSAGSLNAGQSIIVTVTANPNSPPPFSSVLTVSPGQTVTIRYPPSG
jgi:hypothetical protein